MRLIRQSEIGGKSQSATSQTAPRRSVREIEAWLVDKLASLVEIEPQEVELEIPFERYGVDSRAATSVAGELEDWLGFDLPATLLWDYPTVSEASVFLAAEACRPEDRTSEEPAG